jgi:hypothetical protein
MSYSYVRMWGLLILMGLAALGGLNYRGDVLRTFSEAYPSDPAKQIALRRCGDANPSFTKFSTEDRRACYSVLLPPSPVTPRR